MFAQWVPTTAMSLAHSDANVGAVVTVVMRLAAHREGHSPSTSTATRTTRTTTASRSRASQQLGFPRHPLHTVSIPLDRSPVARRAELGVGREGVTDGF